MPVATEGASLTSVGQMANIVNNAQIDELESHSTLLCDKCGMTLDQRIDWKNHMRLHAKKFKCDTCGRLLRSARKLREHQRVHSGVLPYLCSQCGRAFHSQTLLTTHLRIHTGERPYSCKYCGAAFGRHDRLHKHVKRVHEPHRLLSCTHCDRKFVLPHQLRDHLRGHSGEKSYNCSECGKCYRSRNSLWVHRRWQHQKPKPQISGEEEILGQRQHQYLEKLQCPICGRIVSGKYYLAIHMKRHSGNLPLQCNVCGRGFATRSELERHELTKHCPEKQFACTHCDRRYSTPHGLEQHVRTHTGEKPFECKECGERFTFSGQLYIHRQRRHNIAATRTTSLLNAAAAAAVEDKIDEEQSDIRSNQNECESSVNR